MALVRRIDVDADAKISYPEFCDTIKAQDFSRSKAPEQSQQQFSQASNSRGFDGATLHPAQRQAPEPVASYLPSRDAGLASASDFGRVDT